MVLAAFFRALPLALPLMIVSVVIASIVCSIVGQRLRCGPLAAWLLIAGFGVFAALTLTPTDSSLAGYSGGSTSISLAVDWPGVHRITSMSSESLNLAAGAFLGLGGGAVARSTGLVRYVLCVLAAPVAAELAQWAFPALGRSGFLMTDVVINWVGIGSGLLFGWVALTMLRAYKRPTPPPGGMGSERARVDDTDAVHQP